MYSAAKSGVFTFTQWLATLFGGTVINAEPYEAPLTAGKAKQVAIELAAAASALKHRVEGDYHHDRVSGVEKLAGGDSSGRVRR